ncbi:hypothetical protein TNCV_2172071 [Trichonephila clavipes]|nr:hypothetical protein TNCV_2172071 [Trichonephila clavipes]
MPKKRAPCVIDCPASMRPTSRQRSESSIRFLEVIETLSEGGNINVALFSYTKAFGDGPLHFEPRSSDEDNTRAGNPSPNYRTTPTGGRLSSRQI